MTCLQLLLKWQRDADLDDVVEDDHDFAMPIDQQDLGMQQSVLVYNAASLRRFTYSVDSEAVHKY